MIIAHKNQQGDTQLLIDHLINVGGGCYELGKDVNLPYMGLLVGALHDIGKADPKFQNMINGGTGEKVNHSSAGAKYVYEIFKSLVSYDEKYKEPLFNSYIEIIMYVIESHHGVFDIINFNDNFPNCIYRRIFYDKLNDSYSYNEVKEFVQSIELYIQNNYEINLENLILLGFEEYKNILSKLGIAFDDITSSKIYYYNYCIIRLLLSILKNEDIFDTINAYNTIIEKMDKPSNDEITNYYYAMIENEYASYPEPTSPINKARRDISNQIRGRCDTDSYGIYCLDLPTGAGKTKLSLLYSLHQMKNNEKKKMFYIAPYLSILEQNAQQIKKTLGNDIYILEHHSNVIDTSNKFKENGDMDSIGAMKEYVKETWDQKIVLSSMVQFTNTLFKAKSSNIRRFYNLANSLIILDEVQSMPTEMTHNFNLMINFISKAMNSNIILCSATQPSFDHPSITYRLDYGGNMGEDRNLVVLNDDHRNSFLRTTVNVLNEGKASDISDLFAHIIENPLKSTLIILNTKKAVENLYNMLSEHYGTTEDLYYLTTNMCPRHRLDIIEEIRIKLGQNIPIVLVSTSLIEAGVDLDFSTLYRSFAGIDSIVQAMGRCNREGKLSAGIVNLININEKEENLDMLPSIKQRKHITEQLLSDNPEFDLESLNKAYYSKVYSNTKDLDYRLDTGDTMLDLLSINNAARSSVGDAGLNIQSIKEASDKFNLIEDNSISVIVYYKESFALIEELFEILKEFDNYRGNKDRIYDIKQLIKKLQPYTINLYSINNLQDKLVRAEGLEFFDIKILNETNYNERIGLTKESELESFII